MPQQEGGLFQIDLTFYPIPLLFHYNSYLIIGEYHHLIREARLSALISHLVPLSISRHVTILVRVLCASYPQTHWHGPVEHSKVQINSDPSTIIYLG